MHKGRFTRGISFGAPLLTVMAGCYASTDGTGDPSGSNELIGTASEELTIQEVALKLQSAATGSCIDDTNGSTSAGTGYQEWQCYSGSANQQYNIWDQGNLLHDIRNVKSNLCLTLLNGTNGSQVVQAPCASPRTSNQLWYLTDAGNGGLQISNYQYWGQCIDLSGGSYANGTVIQEWTCDQSGSNANQRWNIFHDTNGSTWHQDFRDDFNGTLLNAANWQSQDMDWVNGERQCYDNTYSEGGQHKTLEVSNGTLKLRAVHVASGGCGRDGCVVSDGVLPGGFGYPNCQNYARGSGNGAQNGAQYAYAGTGDHNAPFVAARITSKERAEFSQGRWTASLHLYTWTYGNTTGQASGLSGMFPAWWVLGHRNDEKPVSQVGWPGDENVCWPGVGSGEIDIMEHYGSGGANQWAMRGIKNNGCQNGDWSTYQLNGNGDLSAYHTFQMENSNNNVTYRLDGNQIGQNVGIGNNYPEFMNAILNYAVKDYDMDSSTKEYAMEIDWVMHESWY